MVDRTSMEKTSPSPGSQLSYYSIAVSVWTTNERPFPEADRKERAKFFFDLFAGHAPKNPPNFAFFRVQGFARPGPPWKRPPTRLRLRGARRIARAGFPNPSGDVGFHDLRNDDSRQLIASR